MCRRSANCWITLQALQSNKKPFSGKLGTQAVKLKTMTRPGAGLLGEGLAGLTVASMLMPQAVAYAAIAGVPSVHAMVAALVGLSFYAVLGSSRFSMASATSSAAAVFASVVASRGQASGYALVGFTGGLFILAAAFNVDFLATFISRPVLRGFAFALALSIAVKQLPQMTGIAPFSGNTPQLMLYLLQNLSSAHVPTLIVGVCTLVFWLLLRYLRKKYGWIQPSLWVIVVGTLVAVMLPLQQWGVAQVGLIDVGRLTVQWPAIAWEDWVFVAHVTPALFMVLFAESWGTSRSLALAHGDAVRPRREMLALGVANIASGMLQGLPVGCGYSASLANAAVGGRSKWTGVFAAGLIALMLWNFQKWLAMLPTPVLAAMIVGMLMDSFGPRPLLASLKLGGDAWLALVTVVGVLVLGVMMGMLLSVGLSVLLALRRFSRPHVSELGRLPATRDFLDMAQHSEVQRQPGVLIMRPEEPVFFANAEAIFQQVHTRSREEGLRTVVLSLEQCDDLDTTSVETLSELRQKLHTNGQRLLLARVKDRPRTALKRLKNKWLDHEWDFYWSVDDAVNDAQALARAE